MEHLPDGTPTQLWLDPANDDLKGVPNLAERNIRCVELSPERLFPTWRDLRQGAPQSGWWPVLVGGPEESQYAQQQFFLDNHPPPVAHILAEATRIDPLDWFARRERRWRQYCADDLRLQEDFEALTRTAGIWPETSPDHSDRLLEESLVEFWTRGTPGMVLLIPCREPWEIPAWLNLGGWNDYPSAAENTAIWHHWHQRWGATIVTVDESSLGGVATRFPVDRKEALELAWQQFFYDNDAMTPDGAFQAQTIGELAQQRMQYPVWMFWWD